MADRRHLKELVHAYTFGAVQFKSQARRAEVVLEKMRAAIIMQAWLDGYNVVEVGDEIIIQEEVR